MPISHLQNLMELEFKYKIFFYFIYLSYLFKSKSNYFVKFLYRHTSNLVQYKKTNEYCYLHNDQKYYKQY